MRAAAVATRLAPHQEQLHFKRLEIADGLLILYGEQTRVVWGKVESADVAADDVKVQRLLEMRDQFGTLDGHNVDLQHP